MHAVTLAASLGVLVASFLLATGLEVLLSGGLVAPVTLPRGLDFLIAVTTVASVGPELVAALERLMRSWSEEVSAPAS